VNVSDEARLPLLANTAVATATPNALPKRCLQIDDRVVQIRVQDGQCTTSEGMDLSAPDVVITTDMQTLNDLLAGRLAPTRALAAGHVKVQGDAHALERLVRLFPLGHLRPAQEPASPSRR
jgi:putative sterol carrier protein